MKRFKNSESLETFVSKYLIKETKLKKSRKSFKNGEEKIKLTNKY